MNKAIIADIEKRGDIFGVLIYTKKGLLQFVTYVDGVVSSVSQEFERVSMSSRKEGNVFIDMGEWRVEE